jgi:hypothetical protein
MLFVFFNALWPLCFDDSWFSSFVVTFFIQFDDGQGGHLLFTNYEKNKLLVIKGSNVMKRGQQQRSYIILIEGSRKWCLFFGQVNMLCMTNMKGFEVLVFQTF